MSDYLYVHLDTTNNSLVTKGIQHQDFYRSLMHHPQNLLLLDPAADAGQFEPHTGLKIIEGFDEVDFYLSSLRKRREKGFVKWLDFTELSMVKQLTPQEIAELLYFGHMKMHLRSPFFYKLQNNFAYFEINEDLNRVYYRYLEEFYRILGDKIVSIVLEKLNDKKSFFRRNLPVAKMEDDLLKELRPYLQEGVAFCFSQTEAVDKVYQVPLFILEDRISKANDEHLQVRTPDAILLYHTGKKAWSLKDNEEILKYS